MTGHRCCVCGFCGNTKAKDPRVTFHRIPKEPEKEHSGLNVLCVYYMVLK